jgi:hypothetical protein
VSERVLSSEGRIYIVMARVDGEHVYKVGFTRKSDPSNRVNQIMIHSPVKCYLIGSFEATLDDEIALHKAFPRAWHKHSEWFWLPDDVVRAMLRVVMKESSLSHVMDMLADEQAAHICRK